MKTKRDIYCEYAFWESFFRLEEDIVRDRPKRKFWDSFYDFLISNNLLFNIPNQSIDPNSIGGQRLTELRHSKGGAGFSFIPKKFPKFDNISDFNDRQLNSVFLTTLDTTVCTDLSQKTGILVINLEMVFSADHIYDEYLETFVRGKAHNWDYLINLKQKCPSICYNNSLILADRYILSEVQELRNPLFFDMNIKPLFESLLPTSLDSNVDYNICIISEIQPENENLCIGKIEDLIRTIRPELQFSLTILNTNRIHDRSILTNNILLTSGAGFDIFGRNGRPIKTTTQSLIFPFIKSNSGNNNIYLAWIYNILEETRNRPYDSTPIRHHLLDHYYEEPPTKRETYNRRNRYEYRPRRAT